MDCISYFERRLAASILATVVAVACALAAVPAVAQSVCDNNATTKSQCGTLADGCWASVPGQTALYPVSMTHPQELCCYDPNYTSCGPVIQKDGGTTLQGAWPKGAKRCGVMLLSASTTCQYANSGCANAGYTKLCANLYGSWCANDCTQSCESQGKLACGDKCYDPRVDKCLDGKICAKKHDALCGGQCIDYAVKHCVDDVPCDLGDDEVCGKSACYKSATEKCIRDKYVCGKADDDVCGPYNKCIDFAKNKCIDDKICDLADDDTCDGRCIDFAKNKCVDGHFCGPNDDAHRACRGCYKKQSGAMGAMCYANDECGSGWCSGATTPCIKGKCVCNDDGDCKSGEYCWKGVAGIGTNACKSKLGNGKACAKDKQCKSGRCNALFCRACTKDNQCPNGSTCANGICK